MQRTYDWLHGRIPVGRGPCSALCRSLLRAGVHGNGGVLSSQGTVIFGSEAAL